MQLTKENIANIAANITNSLTKKGKHKNKKRLSGYSCSRRNSTSQRFRRNSKSQRFRRNSKSQSSRSSSIIENQLAHETNLHEHKCVELIKNFEKNKNKEYKIMMILTAVSIFIACCLAADVIFNSNSFKELKFSNSGVEIPFPIYMIIFITALFIEESILIKELILPNKTSMIEKFNTNTELDETHVSTINTVPVER